MGVKKDPKLKDSAARNIISDMEFGHGIPPSQTIATLREFGYLGHKFRYVPRVIKVWGA
jgi:hypothetical protein